MDLTVQDIHTFVNAINAGRAAVGLPVIDRIEYDECDPGLPFSCLSAHHLFNTDPLSGHVGGFYVRLRDNVSTIVQLANALDTDIEEGEIVIPDDIRIVTDKFDRSHKGNKEWQELRNLFVAAGYIEGSG